MLAILPFFTVAEDCEFVPLRALTNVVQDFAEEAILAKHSCIVNTWTTETGRLFITFETTLTPEDNPRNI